MASDDLDRELYLSDVDRRHRARDEFDALKAAFTILADSTISFDSAEYEYATLGKLAFKIRRIEVKLERLNKSIDEYERHRDD